MGIVVPNRAITKRICQALRDGQPMDVACNAVGIDAPTWKRWLALGEAADLQCDEEDPHCRFFEAFAKAWEYAEQAAEADRRKPAEPKPEPAPRPQAEPRPTQGDRVSEAPSLVGLVVEEAPIEIVIGSRPPWVYETQPAASPVRSAEPPRTTRLKDVLSEEPPPVPVEGEEETPRLDPALQWVAEAVGVFVAVLIVLIAIVALVLVVIPTTLAVFTLLGSIRLALALAERWRAGVIALRGGTIQGVPILGPAIPTASTRRALLVGSISMDRTSGSVAWADRLPPPRE